VVRRAHTFEVSYQPAAFVVQQMKLVPLMTALAQALQ
jgi:hypothetical protein